MRDSFSDSDETNCPVSYLCSNAICAFNYRRVSRRGAVVALLCMPPGLLVSWSYVSSYLVVRKRVVNMSSDVGYETRSIWRVWPGEGELQMRHAESSFFSGN